MHRHFDRRAILLGATGLAATTALPLLPAHAAAPLQPLAPAAGLIARTTTFLATLDDGARRAAMFPWGGRAWRNWNYFGVGGYIKPGLRLEQMTAP